jgi:hypothetical protein
MGKWALKHKRALVWTLALMLLAGAAGAAWTTARSIKGAKRVIAEVDGKSRAYWLLAKDGTFSASVNGPALVRLVSRAPWKSKLKGKDLVLDWTVDGQPGGRFTHPLVKSRGGRLRPAKDDPSFATPNKWTRLSAASTDEIRIPFGTHILRVKADQSAAESALLRLKVKSIHPMPKGGTVDLLPRQEGRTRIVEVKQSRATYQVLGSGQELQVEAVGPTVVKVLTRLDWNSSMVGTQKYQLKVLEDGQLKNTWVLRGRHSRGAVYADKQDTTPAHGETLFIEVPEGRHSYTVKFDDSGRELNLRLLVPRASLRNDGK